MTFLEALAADRPMRCRNSNADDRWWRLNGYTKWGASWEFRDDFGTWHLGGRPNWARRDYLGGGGHWEIEAVSTSVAEVP